jgi:hypothetical protein
MVMWVTQKKKIIHAQDLIVSIQIFYLCNNIMVTPKKKLYVHRTWLFLFKYFIK